MVNTREVAPQCCCAIAVPAERNAREVRAAGASPVFSPKSRGAQAAAPITFGRADWEALTGLPETTADELVSTGMIRSLKVGRRRLFIYADVQKFFEKLAASGTVLEPRRTYEAQRAAEANGKGAAVSKKRARRAKGAT